MNKILAIAKAEYGIAIRSKAVIIGILMTPLLIGGSILAQKFLLKHVDKTDRACAIVDRSGFLYPILEAANEEREQSSVYEIAEDGTRSQIGPRFLLEAVQEKGSIEQLEIELSRRVKKGELFAYLVIDEDILDTTKNGKADSPLLAYHTKTPTFEALPNWIRRTVNQAVLSKRFENAEVNRDLVQKLSRQIRLTSMGLVNVSKDGKVQEAKKSNEFRTYGIPIGTMILLFVIVMTSAPTLLNQVLEEKMQKISEVLISSVSPFQLLMGKLIGTVFIALTLSTFYLGGACYLAFHFDFVDAIQASTLGWFALYLMLALFMYGSVFSTIGAVCSEIKDAQSLMAPVMLMVMIPMFLMQVVVKSPNGLLATALSLFPPTTPTLMLLRIALPPGPPVWQILLSILLTGAFTVLCVSVAGKLFRIGILSQGQTPTYAQMVKWVFSK